MGRERKTKAPSKSEKMRGQRRAGTGRWRRRESAHSHSSCVTRVHTFTITPQRIRHIVLQDPDGFLKAC